ncbi:MAG: cobalamin B12-binding domain-containing protein, partial [Bacteroidota bacterium]|nr:cobalamin B12-binding domain-containing protein [Bacteroidota bacterium]
MEQTKPYKPKNKIRIVTAASLFDGHDAAINIMRRIIQATGVEVVHLGHDRSVAEVVDCAIQEDANAIAMTSYQGGHNEYFRYMFDLLKERGAGHIKIFGGGGGVILPEEIKELMAYGIERIYSPDDGREMGLQGMINDLVQRCDEAVPDLTIPKGKTLESRFVQPDPQNRAPVNCLAAYPHEAFVNHQPEMSEEEARAKDRERWQDVVNSADELQEALKRLEYVEAVLTLACH